MKIWTPRLLSSRIVLGTTLLFFAIIWGVSLFATNYLRSEVRGLIGAQQNIATRLVANQINRELEARIQALLSVRELASVALKAGPDAVEEFLLARYDLHSLFNSRIYILDKNGLAVAAWPIGSGPKGRYYKGLDYVDTALEGIASIGRPLLGPTSKMPTIPMAAPLLDDDGKIIGAIAGTTNLKLPNFLDPIMANRHGTTAAFYLADTGRGRIIAGTGGKRIFEQVETLGIKSLDELLSIDQYENDKPFFSQSGQTLISAHSVPVAGWVLLASINANEVDEPLHELRRHVIATAMFLTLLAGGVVWWMLRRLLRPLSVTAQRLTTLVATPTHAVVLPIQRNDEIGQLVAAFNELIGVVSEREALLRQVLDSTNVGICLLDCEGSISLANNGISALFGIDHPRLKGMRYSELIPEDDRDRVRKSYLPIRPDTNLRVVNRDRQFVRPDGSLFWGNLNVHRLNDAAGEIKGLIVVITDIDARKRTEQELIASQQQFESMARQIPIGIFIFRAFAGGAYSTDYLSPRTIALMSLDPDAVTTGPAEVYSAVHDEDRASFTRAREQCRATRQPFDWTGRMGRDGQFRWLHLAATPELEDNGDVLWHGMVEDVTEQRAYERKLEKAAHYDALTDLPNRVLLGDRMRMGMVQARRRKTKLAVAFIDLDGFKEVNDQFGHGTGDKILIALAEQMRQSMRGGDTLARLGGDEFVAVILDLADEANAEDLIARILSAIALPVSVNGQLFHLSGSAGITFYPQAEDVDGDQLLRQADLAMYQAKMSGKNCYQLFDTAEHHDQLGMRSLIGELQRAIANDELVLHYQPKVNMRTGQVVGAEALLRWQHPIKGFLPPSEFLPMIEDHAISVEIGEWVIRTALRQFRQWQHDGKTWSVSVNIGAYQLQESDFLSRLQDLLGNYPDIAPGLLTLEVVESSALGDIEHVSGLIDSAKRFGVNFSLDDFGTGYSSLTYLKRLAVHEIKIDQSFVRDMLDDAEDLNILEGVIGLAQAFGRQIIAEGVESEAHGEVLLAMGCELAQGYGIARPMPSADFLAWSQRWTQPMAWRAVAPVAREDRRLLFAVTEIRAWVAAIERYLAGTHGQPPLFEADQCRFEKWLRDYEAAMDREAYEALVSLHKDIHRLAQTLCEKARCNERDAALEQLPMLQALRDRLITLLWERRRVPEAIPVPLS